MVTNGFLQVQRRPCACQSQNEFPFERADSSLNVPRHAAGPGQHFFLEYERANEYRLFLKQVLEQGFFDQDAISVGLMPGHRVEGLQGR